MPNSKLLQTLLFCSLIFGCSSPPETQQQTPSRGDAAIHEDLSDLTVEKENKSVAVRLSPEAVARKNQEELNELNQQIEIASARARLTERTVVKRTGYLVGPDDLLEISVFLVEELNKVTRVTGDGYILLPLVGAIQVEGKTVQEIQAILTRDLAEKYLHNPQVTVFVSEYHSHQVAVLGAVAKPDIYSIKRPRSVLEMISMAGGLNEGAANRIRIQRSIIDKQSGELAEESVIVDLRPLIEGLNSEATLLLSGGDSLMVPEAGTIFMEGAVVKPGSYVIQGGTTVLKALSMAGGTKYQANSNSIHIFRRRSDGEMDNYTVDLEVIRNNPQLDLELKNSDIIVVGTNKGKQGMIYFWDALTSIFRVGTAI